MPLLEFRCSVCEKTSELLVLAGDEPAAAACPSCGSKDLSRLLSTFAAHAGAGGARPAEAACGDGPCAMPGMCGPSACGFGEN
jgi:putative FmdB family regulatory protein